MAAIAQNGRAQGTLVDRELLDRRIGAALPSNAVRVRCTDARVRRDQLVFQLEVAVSLRPACRHIDQMHADVTGV